MSLPGVVASTHWIATAVGVGVLERGGYAFDAGVATAFALQIVAPHLNGPGGDVPILAHDAKRGRTEVICGQGRRRPPPPSRASANSASTSFLAPVCSPLACRDRLKAAANPRGMHGYAAGR